VLHGTATRSVTSILMRTYLYLICSGWVIYTVPTHLCSHVGHWGGRCETIGMNECVTASHSTKSSHVYFFRFASHTLT